MKTRAELIALLIRAAVDLLAMEARIEALEARERLHQHDFWKQALVIEHLRAKLRRPR